MTDTARELSHAAARLSTAAHALLGIVEYDHPDSPTISAFMAARDRYYAADTAHFRATLGLREDTP